MKDSNIKICVECPLEVQKDEYKVAQKIACSNLPRLKIHLVELLKIVCWE